MISVTICIRKISAGLPARSPKNYKGSKVLFRKNKGIIKVQRGKIYDAKPRMSGIYSALEWSILTPMTVLTYWTIKSLIYTKEHTMTRCIWKTALYLTGLTTMTFTSYSPPRALKDLFRVKRHSETKIMHILWTKFRK